MLEKDQLPYNSIDNLDKDNLATTAKKKENYTMNKNFITSSMASKKKEVKETNSNNQKVMLVNTNAEENRLKCFDTTSHSPLNKDRSNDNLNDTMPNKKIRSKRIQTECDLDDSAVH